MITSTTSKRKRISGLSSIRSQARPPREIRFCLSRSTASNGRPKSSRSAFSLRQTPACRCRGRRCRFRRRCVRENCDRESCNRYASGTGTLISRRARRAGDDRIWTISSQGKKRLRHWFERSAMDRARAEFMEFQQMQFCSVTFVLAEAILRETARKSHA